MRKSEFNKRIKECEKYDYESIFNKIREYELECLNLKTMEYFNLTYADCSKNVNAFANIISYVLCKKYINIGYDKIDTYYEENQFINLLKEEGRRYIKLTVPPMERNRKLVSLCSKYLLEKFLIAKNFKIYIERLKYIFEYIDKDVNMNMLFERKFNMSFEALYCKLVELVIFLEKGNHAQSINFINLNKSCFAHLIISVEEYRKKQLSFYEKNNYDFLYSGTLLDHKPIIEIKEKLYIPSIYAYLNAITINIYNEFTNHDDYNRTTLGKAVEAYIYKITYDKFSANYGVYPEIKYSGKKSSDTIIVGENEICFVESKIKEPRSDFYLISQDNSDQMLEAIKSAIKQVLRNFNDYKSGQLKTEQNKYQKENLFGIVVCLKKFYLSKKEILEYCKKQPLEFSKEEIDYIGDNISIIDLLDYEHLVLDDSDFFKNLKDKLLTQKKQ